MHSVLLLKSMLEATSSEVLQQMCVCPMQMERQKRRMDKKSSKKSAQVNLSTRDELFELFWQSYPRIKAPGTSEPGPYKIKTARVNVGQRQTNWAV